jgi:hypothetical protein
MRAKYPSEMSGGLHDQRQRHLRSADRQIPLADALAQLERSRVIGGQPRRPYGLSALTGNRRPTYREPVSDLPRVMMRKRPIGTTGIPRKHMYSYLTTDPHRGQRSAAP